MSLILTVSSIRYPLSTLLGKFKSGYLSGSVTTLEKNSGKEEFEKPNEQFLPHKTTKNY